MARLIIHRIPQRSFDIVILGFSGLAAIHMLITGWFALR
jgi:hypothetical protein